MKEKEKSKKAGVFSGLGSSVRESIKKEGGAMGNFNLWVNLSVVAVGFLLGGCHLVFGAHPFGLAFVSALSSSVWLALIGVSFGALTLGRFGIIYAMICVLSVFLRIIISGTGKEKTSDTAITIFSESISLRVCSAVISGFVAAVYEILLEGFSVQSVLYGASMMAFPAILTFLFSGMFTGTLSFKEVIFGNKRIFVTTSSTKEKMKLLFFKVSVLAFVGIISFSLKKYDFFGIDLGFVFAVCVTLFASKRFGYLYGAVVGFISSVSISGPFSAGFALLGVGTGAIFTFGTIYAVLLGGALLSLWGSYVSGISGFLSLLPEYLISVCIMLPLLRYFEREKTPEVTETVKRRATDMVGTMALAYRNREAIFCDGIAENIQSLAPLISGFTENEETAETYLFFSKLINEAKLKVLENRETDDELTDKLEERLSDFGLGGGIIRAFGKRKKYIICSAEDRDGTLITSPDFHRSIEEISEMKFAQPEYYRRDEMVLMECESTKKYKLSGAFVSANGASGEVSGDTVKLFESEDLFAYGLISDGMGSGRRARVTSEFVRDFLIAALKNRSSFSVVMNLLNSVIRKGEEECGVTVDLFSLDLINGEATFIKSGAASSYIKRKNSLFRIKSETMPLGLIKKVDAEKIVANIKTDDYIIMMSDGISDAPEDSPWLIELLNKPAPEDLSEYADIILTDAKNRGRGADDMTVLVMKVSEV